MKINVAPPPDPDRRGTVLLIVLVVVLLLSLAAYRFSEAMVAELEAARAYQRDAEARNFADSAIELAGAVLGDRTETGFAVDLYRNPDLFGPAIVRESDTDAARGRFVIVAGEPGDLTGTGFRFGLIDESSRVNINVLAKSDLPAEQVRTLMMQLPQMTPETADAILDWVDADTQPRQMGAEDEYYATLNPPYTARNGPVESIDELLKVRGVTPGHLFGEDTNRNGVLDPNENDGQASPPYDDGDGLLWRGWSAYLTSMSREVNRRDDGSPRIDVNQEDLANLYDTLITVFDEETAKFILAYRLYGPKQQQGQNGQRSGSGGQGGQSGTGSGGGNSNVGSGTNIGGTSDGVNIGGSADGVNVGGTSGSINTGSGSSGNSSSGQNQSGSGAAQSGGGPTRAGFDLSGGGKTKLKSLYELIDATVATKATQGQGQQGQGQQGQGQQGQGRGRQQQGLPRQGQQGQGQQGQQGEELTSPLTSDGADLQTYLPKLLDTLSLGAEPYIDGRVNINYAPYEVLMTVPGMDATTAQAIVAAQAAGSATAAGSRATTGWLLVEKIVDRERMIAMDPYMTTRGDVFRVQSIGYYDAGGPAVRLEAIIDATRIAPRVVSVKDFTDLGRGFWPSQLGATPK